MRRYEIGGCVQTHKSPVATLLKPVRQNVEKFHRIIRMANLQPPAKESLAEEIYKSIVMEPYIELFGKNGRFGSETELVPVARIARDLCNRYWADLGNELAPLWTPPTEDQIEQARRENVQIDDQFQKDVISVAS
jgi:hypothetical protein